MSLTPKFLMSGIMMSKNFLGTGTMMAGLYTGVEALVKTAPVVALFYMFGKSQRSAP